MSKPKTHFEQVPIELVKRIARPEIPKKKEKIEHRLIAVPPARKS